MTAAASLPPTARKRRRLHVLGDGRIEVAIGGDRYRLPATVKAKARQVIPIDGQPILTAAADARGGGAGDRGGVERRALMERAGAGVAEAVRRLAAGAPVLVLCGPGNNGGDGYVAARMLKANGVDVRVAASGEPKSEAAISGARGVGRRRSSAWPTPPAAPVLVDALFGTGLTRPLERRFQRTLNRIDGAVQRAAVRSRSTCRAASMTDTGECLSTQPLRSFDLTLALGAVKPAHVLAARRMPAARSA